jgi:hypothetical protein
LFTTGNSVGISKEYFIPVSLFKWDNHTIYLKKPDTGEREKHIHALLRCHESGKLQNLPLYFPLTNELACPRSTPLLTWFSSGETFISKTRCLCGCIDKTCARQS